MVRLRQPSQLLCQPPHQHLSQLRTGMQQLPRLRGQGQLQRKLLLLQLLPSSPGGSLWVACPSAWRCDPCVVVVVVEHLWSCMLGSCDVMMVEHPWSYLLGAARSAASRGTATPPAEGQVFCESLVLLVVSATVKPNTGCGSQGKRWDRVFHDERPSVCCNAP